MIVDGKSVNACLMLAAQADGREVLTIEGLATRDRLHGLGQTKYIDDLSFPSMLYARIKRAGIASARIRNIDTSEAEAMSSMMAVLTGPKEVDGRKTEDRGRL